MHGQTNIKHFFGIYHNCLRNMKVVLWTLLQTTSFFLGNKIRLSLVSQIKSCGNNLALSADQFHEKEVKGVCQILVQQLHENSFCPLYDPHMVAHRKINSKVTKLNPMASTGTEIPIGLTILVRYFASYITRCRCYRTCCLHAQVIQNDTKKTGTFEKPNKNWRNPRKKIYWQKLNHYNLPFKRQ